MTARIVRLTSDDLPVGQALVLLDPQLMERYGIAVDDVLELTTPEDLSALVRVAAPRAEHAGADEEDRGSAGPPSLPAAAARSAGRTQLSRASARASRRGPDRRQSRDVALSSDQSRSRYGRRGDLPRLADRRRPRIRRAADTRLSRGARSARRRVSARHQPRRRRRPGS